MTAHIDVMSYLLAVLTFLVGFLTARRHAHFDALSKDLSDRSRIIRQALTNGDQLGPSDLSEDIAAVRVESDPVAGAARLANAVLLASVCITYVTALRLSDPIADGLLLSTLVLVSTVVVFILGEFDLSVMSRRERDLASGTVLGQIAAIDECLPRPQIEQVKADIARLAFDFPEWDLPEELALLAQLRADSPSLPPFRPVDASTAEEVNRLLERARPHITPLLAAEVSLRDGMPALGLQEIHGLRARFGPIRNSRAIERGLSFMTGRPRFFFDRVESIDGPPRASNLDVGARDLPATAWMCEVLDGWSANQTVHAWLAQADSSNPAMIASLALADPLAPEWPKLISAALQDPRRAGAFNALGTVCLAKRQSVDALRTFEMAIRSRPNSATSHWGRALACYQRGWFDTSADSLRRARSLDPREPHLMDLTARTFDAGFGAVTALDITAPFSNNLDDFERLQLAVLGIDVAYSTAGSTPREAVLASLLSAARLSGAQSTQLTLQQGP